MKRIIFVIAASFLIFCKAYATCENNLNDWVAHFQAKEEIDLGHSVCKIWPANPAFTIAALPFSHKNNVADSGVYDLGLVVADSITGSVIAQIYQPSVITFDAIRFTGLTIDTANYQLAPNRRAFGIRFNYSGSSSVFPFETSYLNLYVIEDVKLRLVLDRLVVSVRNGDWDGVCSGNFISTSRSMAIGPAGPEGYASLNVSEKNTRSVSNISESKCVTKDQVESRGNFLLSYNNGHYSVPKKMRPEF